MSHDPGHGPSPQDPERRAAADGQPSGAERVDGHLETAAQEREGEYVDRDVPADDDHAPEHSYVDKDIEVDRSGAERKGEYVDKDVTPADTHAPEHSYENKDIPD